MSQSHTVKGGTCDEAFQALCFLWEIGASVGVNLTFKIFYMFYNIEKHGSAKVSTM